MLLVEWSSVGACTRHPAKLGPMSETLSRMRQGVVRPVDLSGTVCLVDAQLHD